ncbi:MAG: cyclase family protein [Deltaproteobacteria bacterium]|nr:cyclase family protein [Deltaproteobacteria bacterium]
MGLRIVDLSQPFGRNTPLWPHAGVMNDVEIRRVALPGRRDIRYTTLLTLRMHTGTHMDAEAHVTPGGWTIENLPLTSCYGTGVVLDMRYKVKWEEITPEDLEKATPKIEPGDWVVINTGWHHKWRVSNYEYWNHYPALYREAAEWLVAKKVKGVAGTWGATDLALGHYPLSKVMPWLDEEYRRETGKDPDKEYPEMEPAHRILSKAGIPGIENAGGDIDEVTGMRCTIAAFPLRYEEGDGSMVRLVAIVEE